MGKTLETIQKQIEEAGGKYHLLDRKYGSPLLKDHFAFWHEDDSCLLIAIWMRLRVIVGSAWL